MNNKKSLILAVVTAILIIVIISLFTKPKHEAATIPPPVQLQYLVASVDIKEDSEITEDNVELKDFPIEIQGAIKSKEDIKGKKAASDINQGAPIMFKNLKNEDSETGDVKKTSEENEKKEEEFKPTEPKLGFRVVPILIKKANIPPYVNTKSKYDLMTKENSMRIENLTILDILDSTEDRTSKLLLLEIKESDVADFIKYQLETRGFIFIQKNKNEIGSYKFVSDNKINSLSSSNLSSNKTNTRTPGKLPKLGDIPSLDDEPVKTFDEEIKKPEETVELIIGNTRTDVEFDKKNKKRN